MTTEHASPLERAVAAEERVAELEHALTTCRVALTDIVAETAVFTTAWTIAKTDGPIAQIRRGSSDPGGRWPTVRRDRADRMSDPRPYTPTGVRDHSQCCSRDLSEILADAAELVATARRDQTLRALCIRQAIESLGVALHRLDDDKRLCEATDWLLACERRFR